MTDVPERDRLHQLKDERSTLHDLAWELDEVEATLSELQATSAITTDETMRERLAALYQRRQQLEEAVLRQMLHVEALQQNLE